MDDNSPQTKIRKIDSQRQAAKLALEKQKTAAQNIIRQQLDAIFSDIPAATNTSSSDSTTVSPTVDDIWAEQKKAKATERQKATDNLQTQIQNNRTLLKVVKTDLPEPAPAAEPVDQPEPTPKPETQPAPAPTKSTDQTVYPEKTIKTVATIQPQRTGGWRQAGDQSQVTDNDKPYQQTYNQQPATSQNASYDWKKYHAAWQDYYQKYYEYYYKQALAASPNADEASDETKSQPSPSRSDKFNPQDEALDDLRQQLRAKMRSSAKKAKASRHFWPLVTALAVVSIFLFLQYNRLIIANIYAYVSPGNVTSDSIIVDPTSVLNVGPDPKLIIPKINVDVPVAYDIANDDDSTMKAMENGVAHFSIPGADAHPGEVGNTVISGHSSNEVFDRGEYKFIFAKLTELEKDDVIYADYKGKRYTYKVTKMEEVQPTDVHKLIYDTDKPVMTLITCVPLGTAQRRLLVTAEQINPDPSGAKQPNKSRQPAARPEGAAIPGDSPTLLQRAFGS